MTIGGLGYGAGYYNPYETMVKEQGTSNQIDFAAATKKANEKDNKIILKTIGAAAVVGSIIYLAKKGKLKQAWTSAKKFFSSEKVTKLKDALKPSNWKDTAGKIKDRLNKVVNPQTATAATTPAGSEVLKEMDRQIAKDLTKQAKAVAKRTSASAHAKKQALYDKLFKPVNVGGDVTTSTTKEGLIALDKQIAKDTNKQIHSIAQRTGKVGHAKKQAELDAVFKAKTPKKTKTPQKVATKPVAKVKTTTVAKPEPLSFADYCEMQGNC